MRRLLLFLLFGLRLRSRSCAGRLDSQLTDNLLYTLSLLSVIQRGGNLSITVECPA
jgi:hypothetical protein